MSADDAEGEHPLPAVAVSPEDQSSDRVQSDADHTDAVASQDAAREERAADRAEARAADAVAVASQAEAHQDRADAAAIAGINSGKLDELIVSNNRLTLAMIEYQERAALAAEREAKAEAARVEERLRFRWTKRFLIAFFIVVVIVLVVGFGYLIYKQNQANKSAEQGREDIADCVQHDGKCYKEGLARTGDAVGGIKDNGVYIAVCAKHYANLPVKAAADAVSGCVDRLAKAAAEAPPATHTRSSSQPRSEGRPTAPTAPAPTPGATVIVQPTVTRVQHPPARSTTVVRTVTQPAPSPTTRPNPIRSIICNLNLCPKEDP